MEDLEKDKQQLGNNWPPYSPIEDSNERCCAAASGYHVFIRVEQPGIEETDTSGQSEVQGRVKRTRKEIITDKRTSRVILDLSRRILGSWGGVVKRFI
jgi:hypothetical protein